MQFADLCLSQDAGKLVFGSFPLICCSSINEAHKQYSLLDTTLAISSIWDLQENIYRQIQKTFYMAAGEAGQHAVGIGDLCLSQNVGKWFGGTFLWKSRFHVRHEAHKNIVY
jgi:hypothetical protein